MLTALGTRVSFTLEGGRKINVPTTHAMFYDPDGHAWTRGSLLFGPMNRSKRVIERPPGWVGRWFGTNYTVHQGGVKVPSRDMTGWRTVGRVTRIWYLRGGLFAPDYFQHGFRRKSFPLFGRELIVTLRQSGSFRRLDVEGGRINVTWAGIVDP